VSKEPESEDEAKKLVKDIGGAVVALHALGWTHNDIRRPNIIYIPAENKWVLIDCEYAGKIGQQRLRKEKDHQPEVNTTDYDTGKFGRLLHDVCRVLSLPETHSMYTDGQRLQAGQLALQDLLDQAWLQ